VRDSGKNLKSTTDIILELSDRFKQFPRELVDFSTGIARSSDGLNSIAASIRRVGDVVADVQQSFKIVKAPSAEIDAITASAARAGATLQFFGRSGAGLQRFLLQGSAAMKELFARTGELDLAFSDLEKQIGGSFSDAFNELGAVMTNVRDKAFLP